MEEVRLEDCAYEQLPGSVQRLIHALDSAELGVLKRESRGRIEQAIRGIFNDKTLLGLKT